jgi:uncharacterized protein YjbI with pentapeptide repeats
LSLPAALNSPIEPEIFMDIETLHCPNCGAPALVVFHNSYRCPYCGSILRRREENLERKQAAEDPEREMLEQELWNQGPRAILKQGVETWNRWREQYPEVQPELSRVDLSGETFWHANFCEVQLRESNFERTILLNASFRGATLCQANFKKALLRFADFRHADLTGADLSGAILEEANFEGANLCRANFERAYLYRANLVGASLNGANFSRATMPDGNEYL